MADEKVFASEADRGEALRESGVGPNQVLVDESAARGEEVRESSVGPNDLQPEDPEARPNDLQPKEPEPCPNSSYSKEPKACSNGPQLKKPKARPNDLQSRNPEVGSGASQQVPNPEVASRVSHDSRGLKPEPSMDQWLRQAKADPIAPQCGMFLVHNGVVRETPKAQVRLGVQGLSPVTSLYFDYDEALLAAAEEEARHMPGVYYVRSWLNQGVLNVGDSLMYVLVGADIRPHCIDALQWLVGTIKDQVVSEIEQ